MHIKNKIIITIILIVFAFDLSAKTYFIEIIGNDHTDTEVVYSLLENKPESLNIEYSNYLLKQLNQSGLFKNVIFLIILMISVYIIFLFLKRSTANSFAILNFIIFRGSFLSN